MTKKEVSLVKAVIFDFDGTLVDFINTDVECLELILKQTEAAVKTDAFIDRAVDHIMAFHELVESGNAVPLSMHHYRLCNTFRDFKIPWDEHYVESYRQLLLERTTPYPKAENLLRKLKGKVKLGILTNAYDPVMQRERIRAAGLTDYFDQIQVSGEEEHSKPNPEAFYKISNSLGVRAEECMFIGDSQRYDIEGANAAGMQAIQVRATASETRQTRGKSIAQVEGILDELIGFNTMVKPGMK